MYQERKKFGFELLLSNLCSNFGWMVLVNLIFAVPLLGSVALSYVICKYLIPIVPIALPLAFIFASPFYSGVVVLSRDFSQNIKPDRLLHTYFKAVKENGLKFLLGGIFMYIAFVGCYFSVSLYSTFAMGLSWVFYIMLFFSVIICIFFLFMFYALPLMTVSFDLKQKDIYKNSALMTFGEIKQNFFATISTVAYLAVVLLPIIIISYLASVLPADTVKLLLIIYGAFALGVLIPSPCTMIISNYLYPNMRSVIAGDDISESNSSAPEPDIRPRGENSDTPQSSNSKPQVDVQELLQGDPDEYVFYQGKMIKRRILADKFNSEEEK